MPAKKKVAAKPAAEEVVSTDVEAEAPEGVRDNPTGLAPALLSPSSADLNPAFH